jgi:hypothetical protein
VTERQRAIAHKALHVVRQREETECIRNGRTILANSLRHLLVSQTELIYQLPVTFGLFDRIEVFALKVLHERQAQQLFIAYVTNDSGNGGPAESASCAKPSFSGDELEFPVLSRTNRDGLKESTRLQAQL